MDALRLRGGLGHYSGFFFFWLLPRYPGLGSRWGAVAWGSCLSCPLFPVWLPWWVHGEQEVGGGVGMQFCVLGSWEQAGDYIWDPENSKIMLARSGLNTALAVMNSKWCGGLGAQEQLGNLWPFLDPGTVTRANMKHGLRPRGALRTPLSLVSDRWFHGAPWAASGPSGSTEIYSGAPNLVTRLPSLCS